MPPELASELLVVFSRMEYALKAGGFADGDQKRIDPAWDRLANEFDGAFGKIEDGAFKEAVDYLLLKPPQRQIKKNGAIDFEDRTIDKAQTRAHQTLLMVRSIFLPAKRMLAVIRRSFPTPSPTYCVSLHDAVRRNYEQ